MALLDPVHTAEALFEFVHAAVCLIDTLLESEGYVFDLAENVVQCVAVVVVGAHEETPSQDRAPHGGQ